MVGKTKRTIKCTYPEVVVYIQKSAAKLQRKIEISKQKVIKLHFYKLFIINLL